MQRVAYINHSDACQLQPEQDFIKMTRYLHLINFLNSSRCLKEVCEVSMSNIFSSILIISQSVEGIDKKQEKIKKNLS